MLTCKEFDDFMTDYLDGGLPVWQKYMCWLHVKMCRKCANYIANYRRTVSLGQSAFEHPDDPVPNSVPEDLIKAALARRKSG